MKRSYKPWSIQEERQLKIDYPQMTPTNLKEKYDRTKRSIDVKAQSLGLKKNSMDSYEIRVFNNENELIFERIIPRSMASYPHKKMIIKRINQMNDRAIDRGEWILSITHNLECYNNE